MKILVSACLLGYNVKYDGKNNFNKELSDFLNDYDVVAICPELLGGLNVPRIPSEIKDDKVINQDGEDITNNFLRGARKVLDIAKENDIQVAILKKNSPSCGSNSVYDGTFTHKLIPGDGICARLLKENGMIVLNEENYKEYRW